MEHLGGQMKTVLPLAIAVMKTLETPTATKMFFY